MEKLSVIVAVYNVEKYLKECIESIIHQTYSNLEIILIDDGSTDSSSIICDEFSRMDNRVIVKHKKNAGLVNARKDGLALASCKWVTFVDGDDWLDKNYYLEMMKEISEKEIDILATGYTNVYDDDTMIKYGNSIKNGVYNRKDINEQIIPNMIIDMRGSLKANILYNPGVIPSVVNKIFRRELILDILPNIDSRISIGEDLICTILCILKANTVEINSDIFGYCYRRNEFSMTHVIDEDLPDKLENLYEYLKNIQEFDLIENQLALHALNQLILGIRKGFGKTFQEENQKRYKFIRRICQVHYINYILKKYCLGQIPNIDITKRMRNILLLLYKEKYVKAHINYVFMRVRDKIIGSE